MKEGLTIGLIVLVTLHGEAQDFPKKEIDLSRIADELIGFQDQDASYEEVYENLSQLLTSPVNLNKATAEELRSLQLLTENQIQEFINYRNENGELASIYELQSIPGFDPASIYRLIPFVQVEDPNSALNRSFVKRVLQKGNAYFITRYDQTLETKAGFQSEDPEQKFKGLNGKMYTRFRSARPGDFSFGFTAEQDPGEPLSWNPQQKTFGADFMSYHAQVKNKGFIENLVIGDFQSQFAQGLQLGSAFGLGKGAETITTVRRSNLGFLPYTSANESGFYRGIATTLRLGNKIRISGFYSSVYRDASIAIHEEELTVSAFQTTGLHRNENEIAGRKKVLEKGAGAVISFQDRHWDAGLIATEIEFSQPVEKRPSVYNQFSFEGSGNLNAGAFLNFTLHNFNFFSEAARSLEGGMGLVAGIIGSLHPKFDVAMLFRKYDRDYYSFYSNAFAENSLPQNENGFYWGWKYQWRKYTLAGYTDLFRFPWLAYRRYSPSQGYEWLMRLSYQPRKKLLAFIQFREESKERNESTDSNLYRIGAGIKRNYCLSLSYEVNDRLKIKTRAQGSHFTFEGTASSGMTLLMDVNYDVGKLELSGRHAVFDTDNFDNRQYVYENDVWLAFSLPAYEGTGTRNYVMAEYKANKHLSFWLRYARTRFTDRTEIGSGSESIAGNTKNDIKFQALIKF